MYMDNDTLTPKDRIGDEMLRRMLDSNSGRPPMDLPPQEKYEAHDEKGASCLPRGGWGLRDYPVGTVYAPLQEFRNLYDLGSALSHGTIFRELDLPFLGESVAKNTKGGTCRG